jgi:hypothetical protein
MAEQAKRIDTRYYKPTVGALCGLSDHVECSSKRVVELHNQIETHLAKVDSLKLVRNLRTQRMSLNDEVNEKRLIVNDLRAVEDSLKLDNAELRKDRELLRNPIVIIRLTLYLSQTFPVSIPFFVSLPNVDTTGDFSSFIHIPISGDFRLRISLKRLGLESVDFGVCCPLIHLIRLIHDYSFIIWNQSTIYCIHFDQFQLSLVSQSHNPYSINSTNHAINCRSISTPWDRPSRVPWLP